MLINNTLVVVHPPDRICALATKTGIACLSGVTGTEAGKHTQGCHACLQLEELKQVKDSSTQDILQRLSSARSKASSLSEQLASAKRQAEAEHKENLKLQKVIAHCAHLPAVLLQDTPVA